MDEKEIQIRGIVLMEEMSKKVNTIEIKVDSIYNEKIHTLDKRQGITEDKVSRIEKMFYGSIMIIIAQAIGLVFLWIQKK